MPSVRCCGQHKGPSRRFLASGSGDGSASADANSSRAENHFRANPQFTGRGAPGCGKIQFVVPVIDGPDTPCSVCHDVHRDLAKVMGTTAPDDWLAISDGERLEAELTPDVCILSDHGTTRHFVRGHIQLPIEDVPDVFVWSVWVELDEASMAAIAQRWSDPNRASMPPFAGRLATELPYEKPTKGLQVSVHTRDPGMVPLLMLSASSGHVLTVEQVTGIPLHRVAEFAGLVQR